MGQITSIFARKVIKLAHPSLDKAELLRSVGVAPDSAPDPSVMVEDRVYYEMLERIVRAEPEGYSLPIRVGNSMRCDDYGAFGLAWKTARFLGGSFNRAVRYGRVLTSVARHELEHTPSGTFYHLRRAGDRTLGLRISNEASVASIVSISREVCSTPFRPEAVYFRHAAPSNTSAHEAFFGGQVIFGADKDALFFEDAFLKMPNRLGDESVSQFFQAHLDAELEKLSDDAGLERRVQIQISQVLSEGVPTLSDVAGRLGMSARTLQRRLSEKGYSFQEIVDQTRRTLAEELLRDTNYNLAEVSFLTGFAEQSGFTRAFKRWAGQTPRSYRLSVQ